MAICISSGNAARRSRSLVLVTILANGFVQGCGKGGPPDTVVESAIRTHIPSFVDIVTITTEKTAAAEGPCLVKWTCVAKAACDLFVVADAGDVGPGGAVDVQIRDTAAITDLAAGLRIRTSKDALAGVPQKLLQRGSSYADRIWTLARRFDEAPPRHKLLKRTHKEGDGLTFRGKTYVQKTADRWCFPGFEMEGGTPQLGKPRAAFGSDHISVAEYLASRQALADQFARLIQDCGNEQTEQFDQLLAATRPGKSYVGTYEASAWGRDSGSGAIRFTFGSQKQDGTSIELTAADAHDLSRTRRFVGVIVDTPGEEKPLRLKPVVDDGVTDDKPCWPPMRKGLNMEIRCAVHGPELVVEWGIMRRESMLKLDSQQ